MRIVLHNRYRYPTDTAIWEGEVTWVHYESMVERIIRQYFLQPNYFRINGEPVFSIFSFRDLVNSFGDLGINSMTSYNWRMAGLDEDYIRWTEDGIALQNRWDERLDIPYFPVVSNGWGNTPESFSAYLQQAKDYADERPDQTPLIMINAWNEWVEGANLEPDMKWGYGYLEAVKKVMSGTYDRYSPGNDH